jgi:hypothetical protein
MAEGFRPHAENGHGRLTGPASGGKASTFGFKRPRQTGRLVRLGIENEKEPVTACNHATACEAANQDIRE